jgi:lipoate-protein ligase B
MTQMTHMSHSSQQPTPPTLTREPIFWGEEIPYDTALARQAAVHKLRVLGEISDQFFYLTHPPVITYGRATNLDDLRVQPHGIPTVEVPRGGLATYHGPGQLIGYIIMDLKNRASGQAPDIHAYLRAIEEGLIAFLHAEFDLPACRREGFTGVWTHGFNAPLPGSTEVGVPRKLASIGVSARKWITSHGFALNLHPDMNAFRSIVPCGITDAAMTSVEMEHQLAGREYQRASMEELATRTHEHLVAALAAYGW